MKIFLNKLSKRLEMANEDNRIQGYADGVFWERNTGALQKKIKNV